MKLGLKIIKTSIRGRNKVGKTHTKTASNFLENLTLETFESVLSFILKKAGGGEATVMQIKSKKIQSGKVIFEKLWHLRAKLLFPQSKKETKNNLFNISI